MTGLSQSLIRRIERPAGANIPEQLEAFLRQLGGPAWIDVPGRDTGRKRMVVSLLHGNEPSSIRAVHAWLRSDHEPAVNVSIYIGSVEAALKAPGFAYRSLPGERDANRCYGPIQPDRQGRIAQAFTQMFCAEDFEALIDIHNNTGHNPAYGIGYGVDPARLNLCRLFADWYMSSDLCMHTLVEMSERHCPSISVECGRAGDPAADAVALAGLDRFLHLDDLGLAEPVSQTIRILRHPRRVHLAADVQLAFAERPQRGVDLTLRDDIDRHNFEVLMPGTVLGWVGENAGQPLSVLDKEGQELTAALFEVRDGVLMTRESMIPIMMTTDLQVARSDCLFYAMAPA